MFVSFFWSVFSAAQLVHPIQLSFVRIDPRLRSYLSITPVLGGEANALKVRIFPGIVAGSFVRGYVLPSLELGNVKERWREVRPFDENDRGALRLCGQATITLLAVPSYSQMCTW